MTDAIRPRIDYALLGRAFDYYLGLGYTYVEVPYAVSHDIIRLTLPPQYEPDYVAGLGCLVGSAEQSLLSLDLGPGSYMAVSPCFRPEPVLCSNMPRRSWSASPKSRSSPPTRAGTSK